MRDVSRGRPWAEAVLLVSEEHHDDHLNLVHAMIKSLKQMYWSYKSHGTCMGYT